MHSKIFQIYRNCISLGTRYHSKNFFSFGSAPKLKTLFFGSIGVGQKIEKSELYPAIIWINASFPNLEQLSLSNLPEFNLITENWETFVPKNDLDSIMLWNAYQFERTWSDRKQNDKTFAKFFQQVICQS